MNRKEAPVVVLHVEGQPPKAFSTDLFGIKNVIVAQRTSHQVYTVINRMAKLRADQTNGEEIKPEAMEEFYVCQLITIEDALRFNLKKTRWWWPFNKKWNQTFSAQNIRKSLTGNEVGRLVDLIHMLEEHGEIDLNGQKKKKAPARKVTAS